MADAATPALARMEQAQRAVDQSVSAAQASQPWTIDLVTYLALGLLGFGCLSILLTAILLWRSKSTAHEVLRAFGILSIICVSAVLLVVGYSNEQLTPIVGLFGAIAGYLLGKADRPEREAGTGNAP